jgi:hypothetical protein
VTAAIRAISAEQPSPFRPCRCLSSGKCNIETKLLFRLVDPYRCAGPRERRGRQIRALHGSVHFTDGWSKRRLPVDQPGNGAGPAHHKTPAPRSAGEENTQRQCGRCCPTPSSAALHRPSPWISVLRIGQSAVTPISRPRAERWTRAAYLTMAWCPVSSPSSFSFSPQLTQANLKPSSL